MCGGGGAAAKGEETFLRVLGAEHPDTLRQIGSGVGILGSRTVEGGGGTVGSNQGDESQGARGRTFSYAEEHCDDLCNSIQGRWEEAEGLQGQIKDFSLRSKHPHKEPRVKNQDRRNWRSWGSTARFVLCGFWPPINVNNIQRHGNSWCQYYRFSTTMLKESNRGFPELPTNNV